MTLICDTPRIVTVFGGSGFVGRHLVRILARDGYRVRVAVRRPDLAGHLLPLGAVGQIVPVQANLRYRASVEAAVAGAEAVVNLVGIMAENRRQTHAAVHAFGARTVAEAAKAAGAARLVHLSAIGADPASPSSYARSKADGEAAVLDVVPEAVVMRPSVIFGPEDHFFNLFARLAILSPALPLIGGGACRLQPVYVGNVAAAIAAAAAGNGTTAGTIYELGGPQVVTLADCLRLVLAETGRRRPLIGLSFRSAAVIARLTGWLPGAPLTPDAVELLKTPNVVSEAAIAEGRTLAGLSIDQTAMAAVLPGYLYRFRPKGQYDRLGDDTRSGGNSALS